MSWFFILCYLYKNYRAELNFDKKEVQAEIVSPGTTFKVMTQAFQFLRKCILSHHNKAAVHFTSCKLCTSLSQYPSSI